MKTTTSPSTAQRTAELDDLQTMLEGIHIDSLHQLSQRLLPHHLTISQYLALAFVARQGMPSTLTEIGAHIDAPPSSMTSIVDRMVTMGLVVREQHPEDRRSFMVSITSEGEALLSELTRTRRQDLEFLLDGISDDEVHQLTGIFRHLQERISILLRESRSQ